MPTNVKQCQKTATNSQSPKVSTNATQSLRSFKQKDKNKYLFRKKKKKKKTRKRGEKKNVTPRHRGPLERPSGCWRKITSGREVRPTNMRVFVYLFFLFHVFSWHVVDNVMVSDAWMGKTGQVPPHDSVPQRSLAWIHPRKVQKWSTRWKTRLHNMGIVWFVFGFHVEFWESTWSTGETASCHGWCGAAIPKKQLCCYKYWYSEIVQLNQRPQRPALNSSNMAMIPLKTDFTNPLSYMLPSEGLCYHWNYTWKPRRIYAPPSHQDRLRDWVGQLI